MRNEMKKMRDFYVTDEYVDLLVERIYNNISKTAALLSELGYDGVDELTEEHYNAITDHVFETCSIEDAIIYSNKELTK